MKVVAEQGSCCVGVAVCLAARGVSVLRWLTPVVLVTGGGCRSQVGEAGEGHERGRADDPQHVTPRYGAIRGSRQADRYLIVCDCVHGILRSFIYGVTIIRRGW